MLESVSKLVDKNFVIGFFLPSLLGVYVAWHLFPCPSWASDVCSSVKSENPFANLTYLALGVWLLAVLLLTLNYALYRLLEGYLPPISWLVPLTYWHRFRARSLQRRYDSLKQRGNRTASSRLKYDLLNRYPMNEAEILPTRFGNAIRAFERYATEVYGIDGIVGWLRLGSVVSKDFMDTINGARARVDFFVNVWFLAWIIAIAAAVRLVLASKGTAAALALDGRTLEITILCALAVAWIAYFWSLGPLVSWGDLVKSAFDCYLPALGPQLGYDLPRTESARRSFWTDISKVFIFRNVLPDGRWTLTAPKQGQGGGEGQAGDGTVDDQQDE